MSKKEEYSSLHLPVKIGNEETKNNRERESNIIFLSLSVSLSSIAMTKKKEKERGGIQLMNSSLQTIFSVRTKENYLRRIYICVLC